VPRLGFDPSDEHRLRAIVWSIIGRNVGVRLQVATLRQDLGPHLMLCLGEDSKIFWVSNRVGVGGLGSVEKLYAKDGRTQEQQGSCVPSDHECVIQLLSQMRTSESRAVTPT